MRDFLVDFTPPPKILVKSTKRFLTDNPMSIQLAEDDYVRVRYDAKVMRWIANRPSRIKYPTARKLIKQYRKEYAEKLG